MAGKTGSKDKSSGRKRMYNGEVVTPVLWVGSAVGRSTYMAGTVNGELVVGSDGFPLPYKMVGRLEDK